MVLLFILGENFLFLKTRTAIRQTTMAGNTQVQGNCECEWHSLELYVTTCRPWPRERPRESQCFYLFQSSFSDITQPAWKRTEVIRHDDRSFQASILFHFSSSVFKFYQKYLGTVDSVLHIFQPFKIACLFISSCWELWVISSDYNILSLITSLIFSSDVSNLLFNLSNKLVISVTVLNF